MAKDDDSRPIGGTECSEPSDLHPVINGIIGTFALKKLLLVFFLFVLLSSDVFIARVLGQVSGATAKGATTTKGVIVTGVVLVIGIAVIEQLLRVGVM